MDLNEIKGSKSHFCGEVRVDTMKSLKQWLPSVSQSAENSVSLNFKCRGRCISLFTLFIQVY